MARPAWSGQHVCPPSRNHIILAVLYVLLALVATSCMLATARC